MSTIGKVSTARGWTALSWTMILAATMAVASTARVFSGTVDEPAHLADEAAERLLEHERRAERAGATVGGL